MLQVHQQCKLQDNQQDQHFSFCQQIQDQKMLKKLKDIIKCLKFLAEILNLKIVSKLNMVQTQMIWLIYIYKLKIQMDQHL